MYPPALFPGKSPAAPQTTKGSDDFATDSEDDGTKQNGDMNGEDGGRTDVSRAGGNKRVSFVAYFHLILTERSRYLVPFFPY